METTRVRESDQLRSITLASSCVVPLSVFPLPRKPSAPGRLRQSSEHVILRPACTQRAPAGPHGRFPPQCPAPPRSAPDIGGTPQRHYTLLQHAACHFSCPFTAVMTMVTQDITMITHLPVPDVLTVDSSTVFRTLFLDEWAPR
jgi:hypothetical protein